MRMWKIEKWKWKPTEGNKNKELWRNSIYGRKQNFCSPTILKQKDYTHEIWMYSNRVSVNVLTGFRLCWVEFLFLFVCLFVCAQLFHCIVINTFETFNQKVATVMGTITKSFVGFFFFSFVYQNDDHEKMFNKLRIFILYGMKSWKKSQNDEIVS